MTHNLYEILGVPMEATQHQIKSAYRRLAAANHPDRHNNSKEATEAFIKIQRAYDILSDPEKRNHYDETGTDIEHPQELETAALTAVYSYLVQIIKDKNYELGVDYIHLAKKKFGEGKKQATKNRDIINSRIDNLWNIRKHILGDDLINHPFDQHKDELLYELGLTLYGIRVFEKGLEILDTMKYTGFLNPGTGKPVFFDFNVT